MKKEIYFLLFILVFIFFFFFIKRSYKQNFINYSDKEDINFCYANVMSKKEENILFELINIWNKVSSELDIKWSVCAGSYMGVVRNGGRIPWDDDFDLVIMKKDLHKMLNIEKKLEKYNVSLSRFWGGYKIFFNDNRGIKKFNNYGWNWPFIDIFAIEKDKECAFLDKREFPLKKVRFGDSYVFMYQNPMKSRKSIKKTKWKNELFDDGHRHQIERRIKITCLPKKNI